MNENEIRLIYKKLSHLEDIRFKSENFTKQRFDKYSDDKQKILTNHC